MVKQFSENLLILGDHINCNYVYYINFLKAPIIFATYCSLIFPFDSMKSNKNLLYVNQ